MNVFVETNFVLELALEQQESAACEGFLRLAQNREIRLLLPGYSLIEPFETLTRRRVERDALQESLRSELTQISRSAYHADRVAALRELGQLLGDSALLEMQRLEQVQERLSSIAEVLPVDADVLGSAAHYKKTFKLPPQDAVVYASIRARLTNDHSSASCFVSRNPRDFKDVDLYRDVAALNCKYFSSFEVALQYIEHAIRH